MALKPAEHFPNLLWFRLPNLMCNEILMIVIPDYGAYVKVLDQKNQAGCLLVIALKGLSFS